MLHACSWYGGSEPADNTEVIEKPSKVAPNIATSDTVSVMLEVLKGLSEADKAILLAALQGDRK